uniref:NADH-ubiquinone oxidoreductase chain 2 n=1 Tax=Trigonopterus sp. 3 AH-2016 TaxID=1903837 RepID=A0A343C3Z8_9CUCU|nr:NADH dehydrogenase subunit 2 [Trigonopterus sp. 3 AH-2016]
MMNLYKILFFNLIILSSMISISTMSWFSAWMGLEMNLLAIIPIMKTKKNKLSAEACIKYFIIQAMASSMLLFSVIMFTNMYLNKSTSINLSPAILSNLALLLKMGAAPLHFWLPEVISGLNWFSIFIILTWQKIAPMILLSYNLSNPLLLSAIAISSSLVSGIQSMNLVCLRKIMAYSSINHMGWMLCAMISSINLWLYYFLIYSLINLSIMTLMNKFQIFFLSQLSKMISENKMLKFMFMLNFLSLGGLPPFLGFLPKWLTLNFLINMNFLTLSMLMVLSTLITLFIYMRLTFSSLTLLNQETLPMKQPSILPFLFPLINSLTLWGLPLYFFFSNLL